MSDNRIEQLVADAVEELKNQIDEWANAGELDNNEVGDYIHEVADSNVPVYTSDILEYASNDIMLATSEPELGLAFDGSNTPVNVIAANIYERFNDALNEYWYDKENELQQINDNMNEYKGLAGELEFNRWDICEAWYHLAHDYGLYATVTRLEQKLKYKTLSLSIKLSMSENAQNIYRYNELWFDVDLSRCEKYTYGKNADETTINYHKRQSGEDVMNKLFE